MRTFTWSTRLIEQSPRSRKCSKDGVAEKKNYHGGPTPESESGNIQRRHGFRQHDLNGHNREHDAVGVPPLVWSDKLAADAKPWAEHLATTAEFGHCGSSPPCDPHGEGENLSGYTPDVGPVGPGGGTSLWVAEKNNYHGGPATGLKPGEPVTGHYTQMVWNTTKAVGCATASGNGHPYFAGASKPADFMSILICRYSPAGNNLGLPPY